MMRGEPAIPASPMLYIGIMWESRHGRMQCDYCPHETSPVHDGAVFSLVQTIEDGLLQVCKPFKNDF